VSWTRKFGPHKNKWCQLRSSVLTVVFKIFLVC
jgi:hypothetical protein